MGDVPSHLPALFLAVRELQERKDGLRGAVSGLPGGVELGFESLRKFGRPAP